MKRWQPFAVLVALLVASAALRASRLDSHGLWLDEFTTLWASRGDTLFETWRRAWTVHNQTPLYYLLVRGSSAVLGDSEIALRLPSFLCGALVPLLAWDGLRRRASQRVAVAAVVILGVAPLLVFVSHQARSYALAALGVALAHWGTARALESGRPGDRLVAWGGGVLAVYAHVLCAGALVAILGAVLAVPRAARAYPWRRAVLDGCCAAVALIPAGLHVFAVFGRRGALDWVRADWSALAAQLPGAACVLGVGAAWAIGKRMRPSEGAGGGKPLPYGRGLLAWEATAFAVTVGGVLFGQLVGINLASSRYLLLAVIAGALLLARVIGGLPTPLAAAALACVLLAPESKLVRGEWPGPVVSVTRGQRAWPQWREAGDDLAAHSEPMDPVVLHSGLVEAELLLTPPFSPSPELRAYLTTPLSARPGHPPDPRPFLLLPHNLGVSPHERDYFEQKIAPTLANTSRFFVVASPTFEALIGGWIARRFPSRFTRTYGSVPYRTSSNTPVVVARYEAAR